MAEHLDAQSGQHRRGDLRTAVVWGALQAVLEHYGSTAGHRPLEILDLGGGTGGFAVRVATEGHRVTVVDPSPDALASLSRRAAESGVSEQVRGLQGDATDLLDVVDAGSIDVVLCHGVLEVVDDPDQALQTVRSVLRTGGRLSLLVAQRHAAVFARAIAGHLAEAERLLQESADEPASAHGNGHAVEPSPRRFTETGVTTLLGATGFEVAAVHAVRVFADLVPSAVDAEPGAADTLLRLEAAVAERSEYRSVAGQLHLICSRR